jgi:hypothetical protein
MEERKKEIKLIDGVFSPSEANSLLISLIDNKINYHKIDDFSYHIRTDRHPHHSKERVTELLETKAQLTSWMNLAKQQSGKLTIKGTISIEFDENIQ